MSKSKTAQYVQSIERCEGMSTESGFAWEALLHRGWSYDGEHTVIGATMRELNARLELVTPCSCEDCR